MRDHTGSCEIDFAVLLSIVEHYANRFCFTISDNQPFRIHLLIVAPPKFGKSVAVEFGYTRFLKAYYEDIGQTDDRFLNVSGQNTAAGLMDEFNRHGDEYDRQIAMVYAHEAPVLFGGRRNGEIVSLFNNMLAGRPNFRFIREKSKKSEALLTPVINTLLLTTPVERNELRYQEDKSATASTVPFLEDFLLIAPEQRDRTPDHNFSQFEPSAVDARAERKARLWDLFGQLLNMLEIRKGTPSDPRHVQFSEPALILFRELRRERLAETVEEDRAYFDKWWPQVLRLAALYALLRMSLVVEPSDVEQAWAMVQRARARDLAIQNKKEVALPALLKFQSDLQDAVISVLCERKKLGASRTELRKAIRALHALPKEDLDAFFARFDENEEVFSLPVERVNVKGVVRIATTYFTTKVWTTEQAVVELPIPAPTYSSHLRGYSDALGQVHQELKDCFGYRPAWDAQQAPQEP